LISAERPALWLFVPLVTQRAASAALFFTRPAERGVGDEGAGKPLASSAAVLPHSRSCGRSVAALYNENRPHQGRWCFGKTPMQTFLDATPLAGEKLIAA
jgi:hypothetical protein